MQMRQSLPNSKKQSVARPPNDNEPDGKRPDAVALAADTPATGAAAIHERATDVVEYESMEEAIDRIAELSESILEDPQAAFYSAKAGTDGAGLTGGAGLSKLRQLLALARVEGNANEQGSMHVAGLAMMSLLAVFKDILPSYRIRLPTPQELAVKVSKETKQVWDFEKNLLYHYQQYLKILEKAWDREKHESVKSEVALAALLSMSELLKSAYYFNFRSNLLTLLVRNMNSNEPVVCEACCSAVEHVFIHDSSGEVALEVTRMVVKMTTQRQLTVAPRVLRTLIALPLRVHADEAQAAKLVGHAKSKKRKRDKETAAIEAELQESSAKVDKIKLARCQSDMLQAVVLLYFRILKSDNEKVVRQLLPTALEGLAKFAHLVNVDTVTDLLAVLKTLLLKVDVLPLDAALNSVLTAFATLNGPGKELQIDLKEYIVPLYTQLPRLVGFSGATNCIALMLKCLDHAFVKRREFSTIRVAAFVKQIWTVALHTPASISVPLVAFNRQMLMRYPSTQQLLENEQDVITSGQYTPDVQDPEHANPLATSGWELTMLRFHVLPAISAQAEATSNGTMLQLPHDASDRLHEQLLADEETELYISYERTIKKHPLRSKGASKRRHIRFIRPHDDTRLLEYHS